MWLKSYAKINFGLNIYPESIENTNKHKIETIMFLIDSIYDEIKIEVADNDSITYSFNPNNKNNKITHCLIYSVLKFLRANYNIKNNYKIEIKKNINIGSGLGGGSSNAACVINKIFEIENIDKSKLDYKKIALELGSDIPFFLTCYNCAYVTGIGDVVKKLSIDLNFKFNIHLLNINVNTKTIYSYFLNNYKIYSKTDFNTIINNLNHASFSLQVYNDLQDSCFKLYPMIKQKYDELCKKHLFCILSGSGSTLITIDSNIVNVPKIRTRYAPSPTGYFHIGGARTALFNYLFAKHNNGDFIVRIEDTDIERNVVGGIESQLDNLKWLNIIPDESCQTENQTYGPYIQSLKIKKYQSLAQELVDKKLAYYCFCSKDELDKQRNNALLENKTPKYQRTCLKLTQNEIEQKLKDNIPYVIRLKIKDNYNYEWIDLIRGKISVPSDALTDPVILKANKMPMYNFAVVIDDYDMKITHVLRGEEHISNTPYQLAIAEALNKSMAINYGHLSIITDENGKKLSKRNQELKQFISDYIEIGCLPEALVNFLVLLGWSPKDNNEIMSLDELIKNFNLEGISKSPAQFDEKKLLWICNEYFKKIPDQQYLNFVKNFINFNFLNTQFKNNLDMVLLLFKNQISFAKQLDNLIDETFFTNQLELNNDNIDIMISNYDVIQTFYQQVKNNNNWTIEMISLMIEKTKEMTNKKAKNLFMPIRLSATNISHGCELVKSIYLLGYNKVIKNIEQNINIIDNIIKSN